MSRGGWEIEVSGVGLAAGEMEEECIEGVRVVAILSCRLEGALFFLILSNGICTSFVSIIVEHGGMRYLHSMCLPKS